MNEHLSGKSKVLMEAKAHLIERIPDNLTDMYNIVDFTDDNFINVYRIFQHEYGESAISQKGVHAAFAHWMQGLPAALDIEFESDAIHEIVSDWFKSADIDKSIEDMDNVDHYYFYILTEAFLSELSTVENK